MEIHSASMAAAGVDILNIAELRKAIETDDITFIGEKVPVADIPRIPDIHKTVYAAATKTSRSLDMSDWHSCKSTHCRAGWVVHLAGEAGYALEEQVDTDVAAVLIYIVSDPEFNEIPNFYCDNELALEDMKRLAETKV